VLFKH